jgi:hypothetical protein
MRSVRLFAVAAACVLFTAHPLFAQGWTEYTNREDRFTVAVPEGMPTIEKIQWKSEYDSMFPGNVYTWRVGPNKYSVTVVDYSDSEAKFTANNHSDDFQGTAYWQIDILGSIQYAATKYRMKPGVKVTFDAFHYINLVTGHELQMTNPDASRTYVGIYLHENRLYIFDATVAKGTPPPLIFQQTPAFLDADGKNVRYRTYYYDKLPETKLGPGRPGAGGTGGVGTTEQGVGGGGGRGGAPQNAAPAPGR